MNSMNVVSILRPKQPLLQMLTRLCAFVGKCYTLTGHFKNKEVPLRLSSHDWVDLSCSFC